MTMISTTDLCDASAASQSQFVSVAKRAARNNSRYWGCASSRSSSSSSVTHRRSSCSLVARLMGEPLQLVTVQTVMRKPSPSTTRKGQLGGLATSIPTSSRNSRTNASASVSPRSTWPPGISQTLGYHARSARRCVRRIRCLETRSAPTQILSGTTRDLVILHVFSNASRLDTSLKV